MVMQAREIPECIDSLKALKIPKVFFRGYTEMQLSTEMPKYIDRTNFENYILVSDDTICTQEVLDIVRDGLTRHRVYTGWCRADPKTERVTLFWKPIPFKHLTSAGYKPFLRSQVLAKEGDFQSYFMGWALSGMRRDIWKLIPFYPIMRRHARAGAGHADGWGSDYYASYRLGRYAIPIMTCAKAEIIHLGSMQNCILGQTPTITEYDS
jgi:hypothetical protein